MMKHLLTCIALGFAATGSAVTPLWLRDVQISPSGEEIAFCYKGDIYKVPVGGGEARQLTTTPSYESTPIWSPDGKMIAFASNRNGNFDLYVRPCQQCLVPFRCDDGALCGSGCGWTSTPSIRHACRNGQFRQERQTLPLPRP